ncbi:MAG: helix-turn-helix transcriptional regulator [Clostridia bacterium]|nr:helix-turn-helix transcriptional regulator [Clostridia bacterium]MBR3974771.1 helix-turn-helix transcriptional regulator [Clostridia bacterium]
MYDEQFKSRLIELREQKGVSARDMSLSIGQNPGYINAIESGKSLPSMSGFFYICDFLNISPKDFFDTENNNPEKLNALISDLKKLEDEKLDSIASIVKGLIK